MKQQKRIALVLALALGLTYSSAWAQVVPQMIPHTGTIAVDGTPFDGDGLFKFATVG